MAKVLHGPFSRNNRHLQLAYIEWLNGLESYCLFVGNPEIDLENQNDEFKRFLRENVIRVSRGIGGYLKLIGIYLRILIGCEYQKIHFYAGYSFLPIKLSFRAFPWLQKIAHLDAALLASVYRWRKKPLGIYVHFQGCEFRTPQQYNFVLEGTPCKDCNQRFGICGSGFVEYKRARSRRLIALAQKVFVATPDLMRDNDKFVYLPQPYLAESVGADAQGIEAKYCERDEIVITHSPSDPLKKGTAYLEHEIEKILDENKKVRYIRLQGLPRKKVYEEMQRSHIFVDQLLVGAYGNALIEAVTRGNLGICKLAVNDIDIICADHNNIGRALRDAIAAIENDPRQVIRQVEHSIGLVLEKHGPKNIYKLLSAAYSQQT